jgi:hypothetical protein
MNLIHYLHKTGDPNLTFIDAFTTKNLKGNLYLRIERYEEMYELDDLLGWAYKENVVALMFRTPGNNGCAQVRFSKEDCAELVRGLTKILKEADNSHQCSASGKMGQLEDIT